MKNFGATSVAFRLFSVGFGLFFAGFAASAWFKHPKNHDALSFAVLLLMVIAGLWIVSIGVVGVRVRPGRYVGGGPLLPRVALMPGEPIAAMSTAVYHAERMPDAKLGVLFDNHRGQLFVTDRRVIFSPFRFRFLDRAFSIPCADVRTLELSKRTSWATLGYASSFDLNVNGMTHIFWTQTSEIFDALERLLAQRDRDGAP